MIDKIRNEVQYTQVMTMVENYLQKATNQGGFHCLSEAETIELKHLSQLAEQYEDTVLNLMPMKLDIATIVQQKLKEKHLTQRNLASLIGMGTAKISQILSGKRPPDVQFLKAIHQTLGIDGNVLLEVV